MLLSEGSAQRVEWEEVFNGIDISRDLVAWQVVCAILVLLGCSFEENKEVRQK